MFPPTPMVFVRRSLPPELISLILDYLHDDRRTLANCAVTCNGWLPIARSHLFNTISIRAPETPAFEQLLDKDPSIGSYIRNLTLHEGYTETWIFPVYDKHLTVLTLPSMSHLRRLELWQVVPSFIALVHAIRLQPALRELVVTLKTDERIVTAVTAKPLQDHPLSLLPTSLTSMTLSFQAWGFHEEFSSELIFTGAVARLKQFVLEIDPPTLPKWGPFLRATSQTLFKLHIELLIHYTMGEGQCQLFTDAVKHCSNLRTLSVAIHPMTTYSYDPLGRFLIIRAIIRMLSDSPTPPFPHLERFLFSVKGTVDEFVSECGFALVDIVPVMRDRSRYPEFALIQVECELGSFHDNTLTRLRKYAKEYVEQGAEFIVTQKRGNTSRWKPRWAAPQVIW